jgi:NADH-quinone oxidoreductase subunit A
LQKVGKKLQYRFLAKKARRIEKFVVPLQRFLSNQYLFIYMSSLSLFLVVLLTGITLVIAGLGMAILFAPRSFNLQKGEPYECGIPTHGTSWMQFRVGYYLYAILYLMFDVETIFLFPWSTIVRDLGVQGLYSILFFIVILGLGLAYAWKKGVLKWK